MPVRTIHPAHLATLLLSIAAAYAAVKSNAIDRPLPEHDATEAAASAIARATGLIVDASSVSWISPVPERTLGSALAWHTVVFLGKRRSDAPRDFYRLDVRAIDDSELFAAENLKNLSNSPAGDEFAVRVSEGVAAVQNRVLGQVRSITLFDFEAGPEIEGNATALTRFLSRLTNRLEDGQASGVAKTTVRFSEAPRAVRLVFKKRGQLELTWEDASGNARFAAVTAGSEETTSKEIAVTNTVKLEKRPILWMVDTVRSFSWIGPGPIEWTEGRFFALKDLFKRAQYQLLGDDADETTTDAEAPAAAPLDLPEGIEVGDKSPQAVWPPPSFPPPVFKRAVPGEGVWKPAAPDFVRTLDNAPPAFYSTITRPDISRPYVRVYMFAMDMRQLALHMVGGHEDPQSTTGSSGTGRLPADEAVLSRVVAAFNGAFKTEHGAYGMMVEKNVLLPPKDDSATVASLTDETTVMGSWPAGMAIPEEMVSYRQNMDPLIENGVVNPRRRYLWGFTLDEDITKMHTIRSGICISDKGYMIYAWGEDLTAITLGTAMIAGGCTYGMHLDMNPFHTAFIYYKFDDFEAGSRPTFKSEVALSGMRYSPHRYVNGAPKDFFFLTLRDTSPGPGWSSEGLAQPAPAAVPALFRRDTNDCTLLAIDLSRSVAHIDPGDYPDYLTPAHPADIAAEKEKDLLLDVNLGPWSSVRGQLLNHSVLAALTSAAGSIGVTEAGALTLAAWPLPATFEDVVQGQWLTKRDAGDRVIALGRNAQWLFVGFGQASAVAREMSAAGAPRPIAFGTASFVPRRADIALRTAAGMTDLDNTRITETDTSSTHLRLFAKPKFLGARRLENLQDKPPTATKDQKETQ